MLHWSSRNPGPGSVMPRNGRQHSQIIDMQLCIYLNRGESKLSFGVIFIIISLDIHAEIALAESRRAPSPEYFPEF
jgi:hypothetical protein